MAEESFLDWNGNRIPAPPYGFLVNEDDWSSDPAEHLIDFIRRKIDDKTGRIPIVCFTHGQIPQTESAMIFSHPAKESEK